MLPHCAFTMRFHEGSEPFDLGEPSRKSKTVSSCCTSSFSGGFLSFAGSSCAAATFIGSALSTGYEQVPSISVSLSDRVGFPSGAILILDWSIQKFVRRNAPLPPTVHAMTGIFPWAWPFWTAQVRPWYETVATRSYPSSIILTRIWTVDCTYWPTLTYR